ncbi:hypothetical protein EDD11_009812 [Mortierella claussenii]|nr:hypothetical protein EDD11_009812 [Mortierella claussenii]
MRFFSKSPGSNASAYVSPQGLNISLASTKSGQARCYTPGATIQGRLQLHLNKPITTPCQLKIIFACRQNILLSHDSEDHNISTGQSSSLIPYRTLIRRNSSNSQQEGESWSTLFEVEHLLLDDQILPVCRRQGVFHFSIKLPFCCYPPSIETAGRTISYSIRALLSFEVDPGMPSSRSSVSSLPLKVAYLPLVPTSLPAMTAATTPVATTCQPSIVQQGTSAPLYETQAQIVVVDTPTSHSSLPHHALIHGIIKSKAGVCIGESAAMVLKIVNQSQTDLHTIHLALIRQISFAASPSCSSTLAFPPSSPPLHAVDSRLTRLGYTYSLPETITIHRVTIPIAKTSNAHSSWSQQLQFRLPTDLGLIPTINSSITPLFKVDYFILVSIPVPQRHSSLASRFAKKRSRLDLSVFNAIPSPSASVDTLRIDPTSSQEHGSTAVPEPMSSVKGSMALQFAPIPIVVGTVSSSSCPRRYKWPMPSYMDVQNKPTFIRDRFEEEMIQHLSGLESLMMEDEDDIDFESMVQAAVKEKSKNRSRSISSGSSDESSNEAIVDEDRVPARFRSYTQPSPIPTPRVSRFRTPMTATTTPTPVTKMNLGLSTPPPSPPQLPTPTIDDVLSMSPKGGEASTGSLLGDNEMYDA